MNSSKAKEAIVKPYSKDGSNVSLGSYDSIRKIERYYHTLLLSQHKCSVKVDLEKHPLRSWGRKPLRISDGWYSYSIELRLGYRYLESLSRRPGWRLCFITANFSEKVTHTLSEKSKSRSIANLYANKINIRLKRVGIKIEWITVIEDASGNLHSHSIVACRVDDLEAIRAIFQKDTDMNPSSVAITSKYKDYYKSNSRKPKDTFIREDARGKFNMRKIDIGVADYISKDLEEHSSYMETGRSRVYMAGATKEWARQQYEAMLAKMSNLRKREARDIPLTSGQAMTLFHRGYIPSRDDSIYDWEYEEGCDSCRNLS